MASAFDRIKSQLQTVIDCATLPGLFVDRERRVRLWNRAFTQILRDPLESLEGRPFAELVAPESRDAALEALLPDRSRPSRFQPCRVRLRVCGDDELQLTWVQFLHEGEHLGWLARLSPLTSTGIDSSMRGTLEREQRQRQRFQALLTVSNAMVNSLDLEIILSTIAQQVREVIQTDECTVFLFEDADQVLKPVVCDVEKYFDEMMACGLRLGEGITGSVALQRRGEIVNDAESDPRAVTVPGTPSERSSMMCVPLISRERLLGVITMVRIGTRGFVADELELATLFAGQCSAAMANARLFEGIKAAYDELRETQSQLVQSAKLNALGEMAGGVAHDFNNILAAILGRTQLLLQSATDPETRAQLEVIEQAAVDGAHTVRRVQEFTRVRHDERFETLDVNQVLMGVIELTRPAWEAGAKRRGVTIEVKLDLRARSSLAGNASELREVFTNLVLNAVDAMPWGGELVIGSENDHAQVRVRIGDSGVGMNDETRARIFDPFFTTKSVKGTGLGLSVAYGIVSRHRGAIEVSSAPSQGTTFTLTFPCGSGPERSAGPPSEGPLPHGSGNLRESRGSVA